MSLRARVSTGACSVLVMAALTAMPAPATQPGDLDNAVAALFAAAKSGDEAACAKAAASVVAFKGAAAATLAASLSGRGPVELVWALRCLREIGAPPAADVAASLATHEDARVRAEAVWAAHVLRGGAASAAVLVRAARDSDATVRRRAFDGLIEHEMPVEGAVDAALQAIADPDMWVVLQAFRVLDMQPLPIDGAPDRVVAGLAKAIPSLDDRNARPAFDLLVRRAGPKCAPEIEAALDSSRQAVVVAALEAAGRLKLSPAAKRCARLASDREWVIAKAAIVAVAEINDPATVPALVDELERARDPDRIDALAVALRRMTGRLFGTNVAKWRAYLDKRDR